MGVGLDQKCIIEDYHIQQRTTYRIHHLSGRRGSCSWEVHLPEYRSVQRSKQPILSGRCRRPPLLTFVLWGCHSTGGLRSCLSCSSGDRGAGVGPLVFWTRWAGRHKKTVHTTLNARLVVQLEFHHAHPNITTCTTYWWCDLWHLVFFWCISCLFWHSLYHLLHRKKQCIELSTVTATKLCIQTKSNTYM